MHPFSIVVVATDTTILQQLCGFLHHNIDFKKKKACVISKVSIDATPPAVLDDVPFCAYFNAIHSFNKQIWFVLDSN